MSCIDLILKRRSIRKYSSEPVPEEVRAKILEAGSTQDGRIAMYFESNPAEYARNPLKAALKRAAPDSFARRRIEAALNALD